MNGLQGTAQAMHDDFVKVSFPDNGAVEIRAFNLTKYDSKLKHDVGSQKQLALWLSFAVTVHTRNDSEERSGRLQRDDWVWSTCGCCQQSC